MKFSADQHLAIAQHLRRHAHRLAADDPRHQTLWSRANCFLARGKIARDEDWSSSPVGAACALTEDESILFYGAERQSYERVFLDDAFTDNVDLLGRELLEDRKHQFLFAHGRGVPLLTAREVAELRRKSAEGQRFAQDAFAKWRAAPRHKGQ